MLVLVDKKVEQQLLEIGLVIRVKDNTGLQLALPLVGIIKVLGLLRLGKLLLTQGKALMRLQLVVSPGKLHNEVMQLQLVFRLVKQIKVHRQLQLVIRLVNFHKVHGRLQLVLVQDKQIKVLVRLLLEIVLVLGHKVNLQLP